MRIITENVYKGHVELLESRKELQEFFAKVEDNSLLTFDWETTGLAYNAQPLLLSMHQRGKSAAVVPLTEFFSVGVSMKELADECNRNFKRVRLMAHNSKYDSMINVMNGIKDENCNIEIDTLIMIHLVNPDLDKQLEKRVELDFGYKKPTFKEVCGKKWDVIDWYKEGDDLLEMLAGYAGEDTYWTTQMYYKYRELMDKDLWAIHNKIEIPMVKILRDAKIRGVLIDVPLLKDFGKRAQEECERAIESIYDEAGCVFNLNSPKQKQEVFFDKLKMPIISYTKKGQPATDSYSAEEWAEMGYPIGKALVRYSELQKLLSGYINAIPELVDEHNVLRGDLNSCGTRTGRFASSNPNLQNQPNNHDFPIRDAFIPRPGYVFINYDYSQLELRVMAHMSKDPKFMHIFLTGGDPHGDVAKRCGITRKQAKCVVPSTLIYTDKGVTRLGDVSLCRLDDTFDAPLFSEVFNGEKMVGINSFYSNGEDKVLAIITRRGIVRSSINHQFVLLDGTLKRAEELQQNDELADNVRCSYEGHETYIEYNPFFDMGDTFSIKMDAQWAYIAGILTGDGCFAKKHIGIAVGTGRFFKTWQKILIEEFAKKGLPLTMRSNANYMYLGSTRFVKFMLPFGLSDKKGAKNFKIPMWVLNGTISMRKAFLGGLIDTDGTIDEKGTTSICTKSIQLAEDLCFLLNSIGYDYGVELSWNKTYKRNYFRVHIYSTSLTDLLESSVLKCPHKVESLKLRVSKIGKGAHMKTNKVLGVLDMGKEYLCDLNVSSDDHIYMTGTLRTHNTMNFGVLYGMGPEKYMTTFGVTKERALQMIDDYHKTYDGFARWKTATEDYAKKHGEVRNLFGRHRLLLEAAKNPYSGSVDKRKYFAELRQSVNTIIQGTGADIVKRATIAMCNEFDKRNLDAHFLLQVHDEVLIEARIDQMFEIERIVIDAMEHTTELDVPLLADGKILAKWGEMKDDNIQSLPYRFDYSLLSSLL